MHCQYVRMYVLSYIVTTVYSICVIFYCQESGSEDVGELSDGDGEGDKAEVQSEEDDMEIGEDDSQGCEVMEAAEKTRKEHNDTYLICSVCLQER